MDQTTVGFVVPLLPTSAGAQDLVEEVLDVLKSLSCDANRIRLPEFDAGQAIALRDNAIFARGRQRSILSSLPCPATSSIILGYNRKTHSIVLFRSYVPAVARPIVFGDILGAEKQSQYKALTCLGATSSTTVHSRLFPSGVVFNTRSPSRALALIPQQVPPATYDDSDPKAGKKGTVLVWFRNDLRVHDNAALHDAVENASKVIPVYCFDPRQFGKTSFGFEKTGRYRAKFLVESVQDLRKTFEKLGGGLVIRHGLPEEELPKLCSELKASGVYCHKEVTYEEQEVECAVEKKLKQQGVVMHSYWGNTLYHERDLPFSVDNMPDVYTDFRRMVEAGGVIRQPMSPPSSMKVIPNLQGGVGPVPTLGDLGLTEPPAGFSQPLSSFIGGETEALRRLDQYLVETSQRLQARPVATDLAPGASATTLVPDFSCKISPWLALGCLSPRRIYEDVKKRGSQQHEPKAGSVYYELVWRDFFRFITKKYGNAKMTRFAKEATPMQAVSASSTAARELVAA